MYAVKVAQQSLRGRVLFWLTLCVLFSPTVLGQSAPLPRIAGLSNFHQVSPQLFRGAQPSKEAIEQLASMGVKSVINLRGTDEIAASEEKFVTGSGMRYFNVPLSGLKRPSPDAIEKILSLIDAPENQPAFVHCHYGADRTGMIVALYRISRQGWTDDKAIDEARQFGLKFWEVGMKNYIHDFARDLATKPQPQTAPAATATRQ